MTKGQEVLCQIGSCMLYPTLLSSLKTASITSLKVPASEAHGCVFVATFDALTKYSYCKQDPQLISSDIRSSCVDGLWIHWGPNTHNLPMPIDVPKEYNDPGCSRGHETFDVICFGKLLCIRPYLEQRLPLSHLRRALT
jgi:hypothetical protein